MKLEPAQLQRDVDEVFTGFNFYQLKRWINQEKDEIAADKVAKSIAKWFLDKLRQN